jgi:hypothetical protein
VPSPARDELGQLGALWRYPVKSLVGEQLDQVEVERRGVAGDRLWSVRDLDGKLGSGKSSTRFRRMDGLLSLTARYDGDVPVIRFPDGTSLHGDDPRLAAALSALVGRPVSLGRESGVSHFDDGPLHLVTESTLLALGDARGRTVDARRLRANFVLTGTGPAGFVEDAWIGRQVAIGPDLVLSVRATMPRCVMVNHSQVDLDADDAMLRAATAANDAQVGVVADVVTPGTVSVGDGVRLVTRSARG